MNEAANCCGTTCDKAKLKADQSRVVGAFDKFEELEWQRRDGKNVKTADAIGELKRAIACLREKQ